MALRRGRNRSGLRSEDQDRSYRSQPQFEPKPPEFRITTKARRSAMQLEAASSLPGVRADWDELRREARRIEGDLDVRLSSYAKLGGYSDPKSPASDSHWKSMEMEIETLLARLTDVNEAMSRCAAAAVPTTSVAQKLTRHRDILHEFAQEFKRTRGNIMSMREHAELLTSVRNDINEYKTSSSSQAVPNLLRERAAIHGSITQIDEVTSQAEAIKGVLSAQRSTFGEIQGKVKQLSDRFPVIRNLLGMIKRKKSKDTIILSAVIAGCTLFLIIYSISK
nr:PREDICTED: Golgi SNAP receptor complex member 1-2-like isoform X2 [Musa acuminata subsp. malaccensis]